MPMYSYRCIDAQGKTSKGVQDAGNLIDLEMRLKRGGLDLISAHEARHIFQLRRRHIKRTELISFFFNLEQLTRAGVPLLECLADLRDSMNDPHFREVIASLVEGIEGGKTLSQSMAAHAEAFDSIFISLIRAGEDSGRLPEVFAFITETVKWQDEMTVQTKTILIYPAFVGTVVLVVTFFLMIYLVPQLLIFINSMGQKIPLQTRALLATSWFFVNYWYVLLVVPIAILFGGKILLNLSPSARLKFDQFKLDSWFIGPILQKIILARFANTFAMMYSSGISVLECISAAQAVVNNHAMANSLQHVAQQIESGKNLTQSFQSSQLFPPLVIRMLKVGEATGALDKALLNVSYFYDRDVKNAIKKIQIMIEPLMTLVLGALLGWVMLAVLSPIYDIIGRVKF
jgi:type IV pilus assembly protein PilC